MEIKDAKYYALTEGGRIEEHIISVEGELDLQEELVDIEASYYENGTSTILISNESLNKLIEEISQLKDIKLCKCDKC
jgi:wyosine [tRNA(Phe)-imidazoG37] synthetase (radical SAM superfamily)